MFNYQVNLSNLHSNGLTMIRRPVLLESLEYSAQVLQTFRCTLLYVIFQKLVLRVSSGFPNTRKQMKARGRRPSAFIVFECLEIPMKHEARVFEIAFQSKLKLRSNKRNKSVKIYAN